MLVIGANGAGKSTLLRVLAGKHLVPQEQVRVLGRAAFHDPELSTRVEILARQHNADAARRDRLIDVLGVDLEWHMHAVSDGQRRRVQLLLGLLRPLEVLLLDEVTTDLDLVARFDLLQFLREESEQRGTTILYATHIFDALHEWATSIVYMVAGKIARRCPIGEIVELRDTSLVHLVERWLRRDQPKR